MRITDIEIHKASRRPAETSRQEIPIAIRNARGAKIRALNGRFVIREPQPKGKILGRVPLESNGVSNRVFVIEFEHGRRSRRILENDRHSLQAAPSGPGDVAHDGKLTLKSLVKAEMVNLR